MSKLKESNFIKNNHIAQFVFAALRQRFANITAEYVLTRFAQIVAGL
jgi:hypothetical protein